MNRIIIIEKDRTGKVDESRDADKYIKSFLRKYSPSLEGVAVEDIIELFLNYLSQKVYFEEAEGTEVDEKERKVNRFELMDLE